jgi:Zn-finger nucleic acid-binding protein
MSRMQKCEQCGAALPIATSGPVSCGYCGTAHAEAPNEVHVAVPVQIVQNVVQVADGEARRAVRHCPHCRLPLVDARGADIVLAGCGRCGGIWVDNESARRLVSSPQRYVLDLARRASANTQRNLFVRASSPGCPTCDAVLVQTETHTLTLDVCELHGTWFDSYELAVLMERLLGVGAGGTAVGRSMQANEVSCTGCKKPLARERANLTGHGAMCDGCWREEQSRQLELAEAQHQASAGAALLRGVMLVGLVLAAGAGSKRS